MKDDDDSKLELRSAWWLLPEWLSGLCAITLILSLVLMTEPTNNTTCPIPELWLPKPPDHFFSLRIAGYGT